MKFTIITALLIILSALPAFSQANAFVSEQLVTVSQPGYAPTESMTNVGVSYHYKPFTAFSTSRFRFFDDSKAITWISGSTVGYGKWNIGVAAVNFHAYLPKTKKPDYIEWTTPTVKIGWADKNNAFDFYRLLGGGGVRAGHDNWDLQYERKITGHLGLLAEIQGYEYKYPNAKKSPRTPDVEVDMGVKWYLKKAK